MQMSTTARRVVAASALALPIALASPGLAGATTGPDHDDDWGHGHCHGADQDAFQGGSLVDVLAQVNPATNVGGILSFAPVEQDALAGSSANSGIQQLGGNCGGGQEAFQAGDLVAGLIQVNPATNVGGIANFAPVEQNAEADSDANSGIQQDGGYYGGKGGHKGGGHHGGGDQDAFQGGSLVDVNGQVNPATNVGGIANFAPVEQNAEADSDANSGIQQDSGRHHLRGGDQDAFQGGSLIGLDLQVNPATNVGGILNFAPVEQDAEADSSSNSGIQQGR
ncbi:hypothetical protein ACVGVM_22775 [Pseudonocardia bannensis]|uniref:Small secreted domain DUF320 n=1 Tax=Pseudonocardia bannensis TaxID=630973 RepID=A0A848DQM0_9PSEU|nr:hypothetical protein [Pseudonocardia bannensis]NMH94604.1 hypothetical protein [Pseudonocardia bannensis]